jgi:hypothetical protein
MKIVEESKGEPFLMMLYDRTALVFWWYVTCMLSYIYKRRNEIIKH